MVRCMARGEQVWLELEHRDQIANSGDVQLRSVLFVMQDICGVKATAEKEASCISISHKAVKVRTDLARAITSFPLPASLSYLNRAYKSMNSLSLHHTQTNKHTTPESTWTLKLALVDLSHIWQLRGMLSGRRPNTADPWSIAAWWMVSDQASSPPTQLFSLLRITEDDDDLVKDDRLSSLPTDRSSHGLNSPLPPQFLSKTVSVSLILSYIELSQLVRYRQTVVTEFTGLPFGL